ncbi:MAG TPA: PDZ domain-containing protein [Flavisolibacter sp.]
MRRFCFLLFVCFPLALFSQQIHYDFAAPNAAHHEAQITLTVKNIKQGPVVFRMSRSSPGRYATHEFGKNVYNVSATDGAGKSLPIEKTDAEVYTVKQHPGTVVVTYTLFGNYADGTYASIDPTGYHLNMPATFLWVKGLEKAPISLRFKDVQKDWTIATQLKPTGEAATYTAPNLQYFLDAPTKVGNLHLREWTITNPDGKPYTMRLALEATAPDSTINSFTQKLQRIVKEAQAVFGEVPSFDYGTYTFIASLNPYVRGDGMEHRNSTMITSGRQFSGSNSFLNTFAHEFFHCWNVERIRPKSLEPFNFEKSNMSESLWIAEGFTQYYGSLLMKRAGLISETEFMQQMAGLINAKESTPGGMDYTPIENSQRAVFVDAGVAVDQTNYPNMFTSYYTHGGALALALDLQLRKQFNKSLDGFMQQLWKAFGKPEKPYTLSGVQQVLAGYTSPAFASEFFKRHVYGHEAINYKELLQAAGYDLKKNSHGEGWMGNVRYAQDTAQLVVSGGTIRNTPLYKAGVDVDDVIVQLDDSKVRQPKDANAVLAKHKAGDVIKLVYKHRGELVEKNMTLEESPFLGVSAMEATDTQKGFRRNWLEGKAGGS